MDSCSNNVHFLLSDTPSNLILCSWLEFYSTLEYLQDSIGFIKLPLLNPASLPSPGQLEFHTPLGSLVCFSNCFGSTQLILCGGEGGMCHYVFPWNLDHAKPKFTNTYCLTIQLIVSDIAMSDQAGELKNPSHFYLKSKILGGWQVNQAE